jgi:phosphate:Na+ symporter
VILGATVGTTATGQILALRVTDHALIMIAIGFLVQTLARRSRVRSAGTMLLGLGMIFFGMKVMSDATYPLRSYEPFIDLMKQLDGRVLALLVGAAFTALVQSSSATIGIVILLAGDGFLSLEAGIALVLGAMIGTCVTALLAGIGKPREAIRTSAVHVVINLGSALLWIGFVGMLADFLRETSGDASRQIANAATFIAIGSSAVFIWFTVPIANVIRRLLPDPPEAPRRSAPKFLDEMYLATPSEAVERVRFEIGRLGELAMETVRAAVPEPEKDPIGEEALAALAADVSALNREISAFARKVSERELTETHAERLGRYLTASVQFAAIADTIAVHVAALAREWRERQLQASTETYAMLRQLDDLVHAALAPLAHAVVGVRDGDADAMRRALDAKPGIDAALEDLHDRLGRRLAAGGEQRFDVIRLETELVEMIDSLYQAVRRVARRLLPLG